MKNKVSQIGSNILIIFQKYTSVLIASTVMAAAAITLVEYSAMTEKEEQLLFRILFTSALGISLLFAFNMMSQRFGKRLLFEMVGLLILLGFFFILPSDKEKLNVVYAFIIFGSFVLSHLFVSFAPFFKSNNETSFWAYNKSLFIGLIQTGIFTLVLIIGVLSAVAAVENLFSIRMPKNIYAELTILLGIVGSTIIFLLFQQGGLEHMKAESPYPVVLKFFTQYILIPLLLVYGTILYLYTIKIIILFELPKGWISFMVLAYSVFGILALLLVYPLKKDHSKSWVFVFQKVFFYSLIPLIILLFFAIQTRLLDYGFTEPRYFVFVAAIWLTGIVLYYVFIPNNSIKWIPISLFVVVLFSLFMPYFNAFSVSVRSQEKDLQRILIENKLLVNEKIDFKKEIADSVADNIEDKFEFLSERFKYQSLKSYLSEDLQKSFKNKTVWSVEGLFLNLKTSKTTEQSSYYDFTVNYKVPFMDITSYDYVIPFNQIEKGDVTIGKDVFSLKQLSENSQFFKLILNDQNSIDLMPFFKTYFEKIPQKKGQMDADNLYFDFKLGNYQIRYICYSLSRRNNQGEISYESYDGYFLIKKLN